MADILMSGLKAIASEIATTEGFEGVVRVIDAPLPVDDPVFKLINKDDGPSLFTRITTWLSDRWNELPPAGWLWCFPPIAIGYKMIAGVVRLFGDAIEPYYSFNWNITDEEIDAQWASLVGSVVGQIGGTLGGLWGSLICGGVVIPIF